ncbi:plasmid replication protein RepC [Ochrobactrum sp. SFR4]|uniref:plasmid replication protein RepC n=1 Tax=Ochrobactrum sp. SFR4 TaxID=2717368 RepID=UPI001C8B435F|nr:plasmid replication protein RepC [Ochrobactrum sp. SFR4]MBX8827332.1 replication initiation protein RepC [Ochrobactrum sp. SFR4]
MNVDFLTTPFGGRSMSLAMISSQRQAQDIPADKHIDKWQVYRWLCEGRALIGVGDRTLSVLNALLSFYPDSELSEENGLIVFPSNAQLSLRAHGMPDGTLRRHLAALVNAGLIVRKDSPNGKRYARKNRAGEIEEAFGLSLAPLLARAEEFEAAAEKVRGEARVLKLMRERITLHRRDIAKLINTALEEGLEGNWKGLFTRFRTLVDALPRRAPVCELEIIVEQFAALHDDVDNLLNMHVKTEIMNANDVQNERQQSNSNPNYLFEFEPTLEKTKKGKTEQAKSWPLGFVLKACPDIADYASNEINSWRELMMTAAQVRGYMGISPSAYEEALDVMGQENTATVIACILQRAQHIQSAGGYLRALTEKAGAGEFSVGPMLMAAMKTASNSIVQKNTMFSH